MPPKAISTEARKLVTRGRPPRIPETPPAVPKAPAPPLPEPVPWETLGPTLKAIADPLYEAVGATKLPEGVWIMFTVSWGAVIDHYVPAFKGTPWPGAVISTGIVLLPVLHALPAWSKQREEEARRRAAEKAPAPPQRGTGAFESERPIPP